MSENEINFNYIKHNIQDEGIKNYNESKKLYKNAPDGILHEDLLVRELKNSLSRNYIKRTLSLSTEKIKNKKKSILKSIDNQDQIKHFQANKTFSLIAKKQKFKGFYKNENKKKFYNFKKQIELTYKNYKK